MPAVEPHPRRRRALRRVLVIAVTSVVLALAGPVAPAAAQLLPTETTAPATTEPEPEPVETTTTTEADVAPTTTQRSTPSTSRAPTMTQRSSSDDGPGSAAEDDVFQGDFLDDDDSTLEGEVPTETTTTARDLLVTGDGTDGSESTTTTSTTLVEVAADEGSLDEEAQIWLIVAGLVVVAFLIGVWTWRYWVRTKPTPPDAEPDHTTVFRPT